MIIGDSVPLPRFVGPTARPLSCPREGGVDKGLLQFQFPAGLQFLRQSTQDALQPAFPTHCWKRRWQV